MQQRPPVALATVPARRRSPRSSPSKLTHSSFIHALLQRLRNDADVGDACTLHRVHHGRECPERHILITAYKDGLPAGVAKLLLQLRANFVDVNGIVSEKYALIFVDRYNRA